MAAVTAGLLTLFDLDKTFYIPKSTQRKLILYAWGAAFIVANAALAVVVYRTFGGIDALKDIGFAWRGFILGASYTAVVHLKFATLTLGDQEVPLGIELFYEGIKSFVYRRINKIAKDSRYSEAVELAETKSLRELGSQARLGIDQDALLSPEAKRAAKAWVLNVLQDSQSDEYERRLILSNFIRSGQLTE